MVDLITTDSYFNMFALLMQSLKEKGKSIKQKNIIFCEEKISLMIERYICNEFSGTFNTEVYSFGNFLRAKKPMDNLLTLEGSSMAVKKILLSINLNCFKASKATLAPTLYNLILQLKSAKISPQDILMAIDNTSGILQNKLKDIFTVYNNYENFIKENNFEDQSSYLSYLPQVIENADILKSANVFIVGFSGLTKQIRSAIDALIARTNNLTAILCEGENPLVFVNESCEFIKNLCAEKGYPLIVKKIQSQYNNSARLILDNIFNPFNKSENKDEQAKDSCIYYNAMPNPISEVERIAQIIKAKIISGECRYKDITIAIPNNSYDGYIETVFNNFEIPYFIDQRKKVEHHPLIKLILSYIDVYRKNFERKTLISFVKNPYFCQDKKLADSFENYIIKYNINYFKIKEPFTFSEKEDVDSLNVLRENLVSLFDKFDVLRLLDKLKVKETCEQFSKRLVEFNQHEESAINEQIFDAVFNLLSQIKLLLGEEKLTLIEYKNIFVSGINALEMSIIPQYNDAVFIGKYKETALAKAKYLFAIGLTSSVPEVQTDVSLLSDDDICALEDIKVLVEPKINIVNKRIRENVALALCAFENSLYLSYPTCELNGTKNAKSEVIDLVLNTIKTQEFPLENGYLTKKQGLKSFAKDCGEFADGKIIDLVNASSYYKAVYDDKVKDVINKANKEIKESLSSSKEILITKEISPTTIEEYYVCPYKSFLSHALKIKKRDEGRVDNLSVGNIMHNIFNGYINRIDEINDEISSDYVFQQIKDKVLENQKYKKFLLESSNSMSLKRILCECKKYCYKTYLSIKNSKFNQHKTEVKFGDNEDYPAISLSNGDIKIKGIIDRVDESQNYFRIVDYKTGKTDSTEKSIFAGTKLQLLLYGATVSNKHADGQKQLAGLYYLPISDKYSKEEDKLLPMADGHTVDDKDAILAQEEDFFGERSNEFMPVKLDDKGNLKNTINRDDLTQYIKYALSISELAVKQLKDGIIVPSPYDNACSYCEFKGLCQNDNEKSRKLDSIKKETIVDALKGENQNG